MALRVVIYALYSADIQDPTSYEGQIRQCREHAERTRLAWTRPIRSTTTHCLDVIPVLLSRLTTATVMPLS